jgi:PHD/YefM family antitoxin component YafN of YafNO toxin-antitoxin module
MNENQVPQDKSSLSQKNIKEMCYATNEKGEYVSVLSSGWEAKTVALDSTFELLNERIEEAKIEVNQKKSSPIKYYMELNKMDIPTLADYVNKNPLLVKLHIKPLFFNLLSKSSLQKYAQVFEISVQELKNYNIK